MQLTCLKATVIAIQNGSDQAAIPYICNQGPISKSISTYCAHIMTYQGNIKLHQHTDLLPAGS